MHTSKGDFLIIVSNDKAFKAVIKEIKGLTRVDVTPLVNKQREYITHMYDENDLANILIGA